MDAEAFKWVRSSYDTNIDTNNIVEIDFNFIQSTRHLIIRIQGFLLSIESENIHRRNEKWVERKSKVIYCCILFLNFNEYNWLIFILLIS